MSSRSPVAVIATSDGNVVDITNPLATRTKVTDGTNNAAVKAASTAAVAADSALVVAVSPNNSVAVTAAGVVTAVGAAYGRIAAWQSR